VPIRSGAAPLGVATFLRSRSGAPFTDEDLQFAVEVVAKAGPPLERARRFTHEQTVALTLQRNLLPRELCGGPAVEVAWRYFPADVHSGVGGDWCDVIPLSGARVALAVGDVVGHGIHAAAVMGRFRTALRALASMELRPDELLAHLDDLVIQLAETRSADPAGEVMAEAMLGASCLYAIYDPVTQVCSIARAGHPPPVVVGPDGVVSVPDLPAGPPFGLGFMPFEHTELHLPPGSLLALYTDGLLACRKRDLDEGLSRLCSSLDRPGLPLERLCDEVVAELLPGPPEDDAAMLVVRTRALPAEDVAVLDLTADAAVVAEARDWALGRLAEWDLGHLEFATELIVSELVTNAIRYGSAPITLRLLRHELLSCEVSDGSSTSPRMRHARATDEGGRGLFLVSHLSARWGVRYGEEGKTLWAEQSLDPGPA
jgi:anti-sigma regulatory factor (Ser/Thr protein kinase)